MEINKGGRTLHSVHINGKPGIGLIEYHLPDGYKRDTNDRDVSMIGSGAYGIVIRTVGTTAQIGKDGQKVAVEVAVKKLINPLSTQILAQRCYRELKLLMNLSHPNIARIVDVFTTARYASELENVFIVTKYAGSTLDLLLKEQIKLFNSNEKVIILPISRIPAVILDTLNALKYLRSANVLHRDLKSANLAIDRSGRAVLIDYGLARIEGDKTSVLTNPVYTCNYRAIEVILAQYGVARYGPEADMWSLGCVVAEMITWQPLFMPDNEEKVEKGEVDARELLQLQLERCGPVPDEFLESIDDSRPKGVKTFLKKASDKMMKSPVDLREYFEKYNRVADLTDPKDATVLDFLCECLKFDPSKRMTIEDAFKHPFLQDVRNTEEFSDVKPLSDEVDCKREIEEWKQIIFKEIDNFQARKDTPMP